MQKRRKYVHYRSFAMEFFVYDFFIYRILKYTRVQFENRKTNQ